MAIVETFESNLEALGPQSPVRYEPPETERSYPSSTSPEGVFSSSPDAGQEFRQKIPQDQLPQGEMPQMQRSGNPLQDILQQGQTSLGALQTPYEAATTGFYQAAGPSRTFGSAEAEQLRSAAEGSYGESATPEEQARQEQARSLLGSQYSGPSSIADVYDVAKLQGDIAQTQQLGQYASAGGQDLVSLIQASAPGWTPGMARFEAQNRGQEFREKARGIRSSAENYQGQLDQALKSSEEYAAQRSAEEKEIGKQSRQYLGGLLGEQEAGIQSQIEAQQSAEERAADVFEQARQAESYRDLLDPETRALLDTNPRDFYTEAQKDTERAEQLYRQIMRQYPDLPQSDIGNLRISSHGHERYVPPEKALSEGARFGPGEREPIDSEQALQRFRQLQRHGFLPGTAGDPTYGQYATYKPAAFGGDLGTYKAPSTGKFLRFDPGMSPTRENMATDKQRAIINDINEILGDLDVVGEFEPPAEKFRKASIMADLDGFLKQEEAELASRREKLTTRAEAWQKQVRDARKDFNKAKKKRAGALGGLIGGIAGAPFPGTIALGTVVGTAVGRELG